MAREGARLETVLAWGEHRCGVGWAGSSALTGFRVDRLCELDVHSLKRLFAQECQVGNQEKLLTAFLDVRLHLVMGAPGFFHDNHGDGRFRFAVEA